jgi:hypothetical protein
MVDKNTRRTPGGETTLERVDRAFMNLIDKYFNIHAVTNRGYKKTPVIWLSAERAFHAKHNPELFTERTGIKKLPLISVFRDGVDKEPKKGAIQMTIPWDNFVQGGSIPVMRRVNTEKTQDFINAATKYDKNFTNSKGKMPGKVVYETYFAPMPIFCLVKYKIFVVTEYLQQLNQCVTPFVRSTGNINTFRFQDEDQAYEVFFNAQYNVATNAENVQQEEKRYTTTISAEVLADLSTDDVNQKRPRLVKRQNAVSIAFTEEYTVDVS